VGLDPPHRMIAVADHMGVAKRRSSEDLPRQRRFVHLGEVEDKRAPGVGQAVEQRVPAGHLHIGPADLRRACLAQVLRTRQRVNKHLVAETGAEHWKSTIDRLTDESRLRGKPRPALEDRCLRSSQDDVRVARQRWQLYRRWEMDGVRAYAREMCLPVP